MSKANHYTVTLSEDCPDVDALLESIRDTGIHIIEREPNRRYVFKDAPSAGVGFVEDDPGRYIRPREVISKLEPYSEYVKNLTHRLENDTSCETTITEYALGDTIEEQSTRTEVWR